MSQRTLDLTINPVDSWFFRDARPHDATGASRLASQFPPPAATLAGALRSRIGDLLGIDWHAFNRGDVTLTLADQPVSAEALLGRGEQTGQLRFSGPYLLWQGQRLYPAPALLLRSDNNALICLAPGEPVCCDLSQTDAQGQWAQVRLPALPEGASVAKPLEGYWLTEPALQQLLTQGKITQSEGLISPEQLFSLEPRLGIARNNATRAVQEGLLYQTEHLRLQPEVAIHYAITLPTSLAGPLQQALTDNSILRLGGEGRMAAVSVTEREQSGLPQLAHDHSSTARQAGGVLLTLLTPAYLPECSAMVPLPGFQSVIDEQGQQSWHGQINGVELHLISAAIGKVQRQGGWDLKKRAPKDLVSLTPAGSCWFFQVPTGHDLAETLSRLQQPLIGAQTTLGMGQLLAGLWYPG